MEEVKKKYTGRGGYHGGGRKKTGRIKIYANTTISGLPEEIEALKKIAADSGKTLSRLVIETFLEKPQCSSEK